jgi:hypothetical protein
MINFNFEELRNKSWVNSSKCSEFEDCFKLVYIDHVGTTSRSTPEQRKYLMTHYLDKEKIKGYRLIFDVNEESIAVAQRYNISIPLKD